MEYLKDAEIKSIIPNYENVFEAIKTIRTDLKKNGIKKDEAEHLPYRNIISILGERGSGKTTVFSTFRNWLTADEDIKSDIVKSAKYKGDNHLNLIVPEMIEEGTDILGIILLNIKKILERKKDEINKFYEKNNNSQRLEGYESCIYSDNNKIDDKWSEVFRTYLMRTEGFTKITSENFSTFSEYSKEREKSLRSEVMLAEMIFDLISNLSKIFSTDNEKSLTYVYIDDIDINQERCAEGINTILRYLKHPSVVVFISGDIEKIQNELYLFEMQKEKMSSIRFHEVFQDLEERKRTYVYELLKKVLPFSNRFELIKLKNSQKKEFSYPGNSNKGRDSDNYNLEELINKAFFINRNISTQNDKTGTGKELIDSVYGIFDYKPRGIVTVWDVIERNFLKDDSALNYTNSYEASNGIIFKDMDNNKQKYQDLLESLIASNDSLRINKEIINKCIKLEKGVHINYELFLNHIHKVLQNDSLNENDKVQKDRDKLKQSLVEIIHLFYFFEIIKCNSSVLLGTTYSKMFNAIIKANQDRRVYINEANAEKVIMLYNELNKVLDINQQSEIYVNSEYLNSYRKTVMNIYGGKDKFEQVINTIDYDWNKNVRDFEERLNEGYTEVLDELVERFQGVEYDQELLDKERTYEELLVFNATDSTDDISSLFNDKSYEDISVIRDCVTKNSIKFKIGELIETEKQKDEKITIKKDINDIVKESQDKFKSMLDESFIERVREYISITEYSNICKLRDGTKNVSSLDLIKIIKSFINFCDNKLKNYYWNKATSSHICNQMDQQNFCIYVSDKTLKNVFEIMESIYGNDEKLTNFNSVLGQFTWNNNDDLFNKATSKKISFQNLSIFENSKDNNILYYNDEKCGNSVSWISRRYNFMQRFCEAIELYYIKEQCNELLQDFVFINQNEINECYIKQDIDYTYNSLDIRQFYYLIASKNDASQFYEIVSEVKNKLLTQVKNYTYKEINIEQLNTLLKSVKNQDIYQDIEKVKRELGNSQKVRKSDCDELKEKLIQYIKILKEQKGSEYYASTLEIITDKIFKEPEKVNTTRLVSDIINEEEKKVYQAEYEAQILVMKNLLQKTFKERKN